MRRGEDWGWGWDWDPVASEVDGEVDGSEGASLPTAVPVSAANLAFSIQKCNGKCMENVTSS